MKLLYNTITEQLFPYPRRDDAPVVGLSPDLVVLTKTETPQPEYDPTTHQATSTFEVDAEAGEYRQVWTISPLPEPPPVADWDGFNEQMLSTPEYHQITGVVLQNAPALAIALPSALAQVSSHGVKSFSLVFNQFCIAGQVTEQQREDWAQCAESYDLPQEFVEVVRG